MTTSRRDFLTTSLSAAAAGLLLPQYLRAAQPDLTTIRATRRSLDINGKAANVLGLLQANGTQGLNTVVNQGFRVNLENKLDVTTAIHWHGLHPPNKEDGVPGVTQSPIGPGASVVYDFPVRPAGTHWMHSSQGLQEAFLLAAPLIVRDPADTSRDEQEVVLLLSDFSFTPPREVFQTCESVPKALGTCPA